jgi:hypothetical protein
MAFGQLDAKVMSLEPGSVPLITPVRDELKLLPAFLRHYRKMGVRDFIFIDNNSTDGTTDYLRAQPDCFVFHTDESYRDSHFARDWINLIIVEQGIRGWLVYADVDEHLVYPDMERTDIAGYCARLADGGFDCVNAVMIDMYPEGSFLDLTFGPDDDLADVMGWFDPDYIFRDWPRRLWDQKRGFSLQALGGPRCRLLSDLESERRHGALFYTLANQVDRIVDRIPLGMMPLLARLAPREMPALQKRPINFVREGFRYLNSHAGTNAAYADDMTVLLHYKFCSELQRRFAMRKEGNHYRRGLSYLQLEQALADWPSHSLCYANSRRYRSSADLAEVGLIGPAVSALWRKASTDAMRTSPGGPRAITSTPATPAKSSFRGMRTSTSGPYPY